MVGDRVKKNSTEKGLECSQNISDSVWDNIVVQALEAGMTTEEYIEFIEFIKEQSSKHTKLERPITYYFQLFYPGASHNSKFEDCF